jgi:non-ribosomal peptide synthetase component E (peptide arylation enzyme)
MYKSNVLDAHDICFTNAHNSYHSFLQFAERFHLSKEGGVNAHSVNGTVCHANEQSSNIFVGSRLIRQRISKTKTHSLLLVSFVLLLVSVPLATSLSIAFV